MRDLTTQNSRPEFDSLARLLFTDSTRSKHLFLPCFSILIQACQPPPSIRIPSARSAVVKGPARKASAGTVPRGMQRAGRAVIPVVLEGDRIGAKGVTAWLASGIAAPLLSLRRASPKRVVDRSPPKIPLAIADGRDRPPGCSSGC